VAIVELCHICLVDVFLTRHLQKGVSVKYILFGHKFGSFAS